MEDVIEITLTVQVSIPVTLAFDRDDQKTKNHGYVRACAIENFLDHPVFTNKNRNPEDLECYIDSIGNGEMDLTQPICTACDGDGWVLADNTDHGLRIEKCDSCNKYTTDAAAVERVAHLAKGGR